MPSVRRDPTPSARGAKGRPDFAALKSLLRKANTLASKSLQPPPGDGDTAVNQSCEGTSGRTTQAARSQAGSQDEGRLNRTGNASAGEELTAVDRLGELKGKFLQSCRLSHVYLPGDHQGTMRTVHTAPDGSRHISICTAGGTAEDHFRDRYGRPVLMHAQKGKFWKIVETAYQDENGRPSPFRAFERITTSDGQIIENKFLPARSTCRPEPGHN